MTRPNHTSGPWRIGDAGHTIFGPPTGEPAPQRIADLAPVDRKANARLIAAAPDMLAALEKCRNMAESLLGCDGWRELLRNHSATSHDNWLGPDIHGIADTAQAAIRKATGGE